MDIGSLRSWIGRQEVVDDDVHPFRAAALSATLDRKDSPRLGEQLPPLWHWIYFLPLHRQSELASDGHARRGGFVPPVPLPRRMFAGARLSFPMPLIIGEPARRTAAIEDLTFKKGRTGDLAFVRIRNEIVGPRGPAIVEEQDIVYREVPRPGERSNAVTPQELSHADWRREIKADEALLFRYSALIFNAHRIHYDRPYATGHEGYAGLVVHGQLVATLLTELVRENVNAPLCRFVFRAIRPILDIAPFALCGKREGRAVRLWAEDHDGALAMEAEAELAG